MEPRYSGDNHAGSHRACTTGLDTELLKDKWWGRALVKYKHSVGGKAVDSLIRPRPVILFHIKCITGHNITVSMTHLYSPTVRKLMLSSNSSSPEVSTWPKGLKLEWERKEKIQKWMRIMLTWAQLFNLAGHVSTPFSAPVLPAARNFPLVISLLSSSIDQWRLRHYLPLFSLAKEHNPVNTPGLEETQMEIWRSKCVDQFPDVG